MTSGGAGGSGAVVGAGAGAVGSAVALRDAGGAGSAVASGGAGDVGVAVVAGAVASGAVASGAVGASGGADPDVCMGMAGATGDVGVAGVSSVLALPINNVSATVAAKMGGFIGIEFFGRQSQYCPANQGKMLAKRLPRYRARAIRRLVAHSKPNQG